MAWVTPPNPAPDDVVEAAHITDISQDLDFHHAPPICVVVTALSQTVSDSTSTAILVSAEVRDSDGMHSTVTNVSRVTIKTAGFYEVDAHLNWQPAAGGV